MIRRERLARTLETALQYGFVCIIAPAGYGKTRAIADAFEDIGHFVDVDGAGGGIDGIARAIVEAVQPASMRSLKNVLRRQDGPERNEAILTWLSTRLRSVDRPIVLDDFQNLSAETVAFVGSVIDATLPRTRWIVASRETPELPLGTWIATNVMTLPVTAEDLAFDLEDARELASLMAVRVDDESLGTIAADAQGWPLVIALVLSAWTRTPGIRPARIRTREVLFRFLEDEVWTKTSAHERELLLAVALLTHTRANILESAGFLRATGRLQRLMLRFPLLNRTADRQFRLHDLFRDFLLETHFHTAQNLELVGRLTQSLLSAGLAPEALSVAARASNHLLSISILAETGTMLVDEGKRDVIAIALATLPPKVRDAPACVAIRGYLRAAEGNVSVAEAELRRVDLMAVPSKLAAIIALKLAQLAMNRQAYDIAVLDVQGLLKHPELATRAEAIAQTAVCLAIQDRREAAQSLLAEILPLLPSIRTEVQARLYWLAASTCFYLHEYSDAENFALLSLEFAQQSENTVRIRAAFSILYSISNSLYPDLSISAEYAKQFLAVAREGGSRADLAYALATSVTISAERGELDAYYEQLNELRRLRFTLPPIYDVSLRWARAIVDGSNDMGRNAALALEQNLSLKTSSEAAVHFTNALAGLLWAFVGEEKRALDHVAVTTRLTTAKPFEDIFLLYAAAYRSLALWVLERPKRAIASLPAVPSATPEREALILGVIRSICITPRSMMTTTKLDYLLAPLKALDLFGHVLFLSRSFAEPTSVRLTPSELDVLRAFKNGERTSDVAAILARSPHTVEWHLKSAIRKLGCSGRSAAVRRRRRARFHLACPPPKLVGHVCLEFRLRCLHNTLLVRSIVMKKLKDLTSALFLSALALGVTISINLPPIDN